MNCYKLDNHAVFNGCIGLFVIKKKKDIFMMIGRQTGFTIERTRLTGAICFFVIQKANASAAEADTKGQLPSDARGFV